MNLSFLAKTLLEYPKYRLEQARRLVFVDLIENWDEATTLPGELREELNKKCPLDIGTDVFESEDKKTIKALISLEDGQKIEAVLMRYESKRSTVCISSQVGCALGCDFCATGKMGFKRNLTADEIVSQVLFFARRLKQTPMSVLGKNLGKNCRGQASADCISAITNIVFMGMGEPFLNYNNVLESIKILNDQKGFNLGARHFSVSTVGIVEGIKKLAEEPFQVNLAISLHAPDDELRSRLMPVNKKYPIEKILEAVDEYIKKTNRKVMFEYIMIDGVNDSARHARELAKLMKKPLYFINLIPCNPVGDFKASPQAQIERFKKILKECGVQVNQRYSFGQDIKAACGQLAGECGNKN
jgi:23S rRNA (adenine2503-C2)-methyltransferase